jgi:5-methylcytosine-specific restriction endonuclease McrA
MTKGNKRYRDAATHCAFCGTPFDNERPMDGYTNKQWRHRDTLPTIEHFIPLSRGGSNSVSNRLYICKRCNLLKGQFLPHEFLYTLSQKVRHGETWQDVPPAVLNVIYHNVKRLVAEGFGAWEPEV